MDNKVLMLALLVLTFVVGFFAGVAYEKRQHDTINITVPGFQYRQQ